MTLTTQEGTRPDVISVGGREPNGDPSYIGPWTFQTKLVREVVEDAIHGRVLNACAGKTKLDHDGEIVRNDLNPEMDADHHYCVTNIDELFPPDSFDSVVFDPPFDQTQADDHYHGMHSRQRGPARRKLAELVRTGGTFVELGWNMYGPADRFVGWERAQPPKLYRRGPSYQPVFLVVDKNIQHRLEVREE